MLFPIIIVYFSAFLLSCLALDKASIYITNSLLNISDILKLKKFTVASFIMTLVSSLPEIFIGISTAVHQKQELSLGNVIGSNIIVLTLVIGIGGLIARGLCFKSKTVRRSSFYAAFIALLPLILMLDGELSRWNGAILIIAMVFYFIQLIVQQRKSTDNKLGLVKTDQKTPNFLLKNFAVFIFGVLFLLIAAEILVRSASGIAEQLNLSLPLVGLLLVAIGTSAPELSFGIKSITQGHDDMLLGNAIGSVVVNSSLVIGVVALIRPFSIPNLAPHIIGISFTIIIAVLFAVFAKTDHRITRRESVYLIFVYALFLIAQVIIPH